MGQSALSTLPVVVLHTQESYPQIGADNVDHSILWAAMPLQDWRQNEDL